MPEENNEIDNRITVIDTYPGSGKSSFAFQQINSYDKDTKILYITPFLAEVERVIESCPDKKFQQPSYKGGKGSKFTHLIKLVSNGKNIVSTHALFIFMTDELIEKLKLHKYILYMDEVIQPVIIFNVDDGLLTTEEKKAVTEQDVKTLLEAGHIKIEEDNRITWVDDNKRLSQYEKLRKFANREILYYVNGSLMWTFPMEVFAEGVFDKIFILTHRFDYQFQAYYYNYFKLNYKKFHIVKDADQIYSLVETINDDIELEWKKQIKGQIIYAVFFGALQSVSHSTTPWTTFTSYWGFIQLVTTGGVL
jgi:hypothetical protein